MLHQTAANHHEIRAEHHRDVQQIAVGPVAPLVPVEVLVAPRLGREVALGRNVALELELSQLEVGHEDSIDEQPGADTGPKGDGQDHSRHSLGGPIPGLGQCGCIGIVHHDDLPVDRRTDQLPDLSADTGGIDVVGGLHDAVPDHGGKPHADKPVIVEVGDEVLDGAGDRMGCRRLRSVDTLPLAEQRAVVEVDEGGLDARASDIDAQIDVAHGG